MAKVMIIEDDHSLSGLLKEYMTNLGHSVVMNYNPVSALRILKSEKFDVLLTDVNMFPIDGYELIFEAKKLNPKIRIIAMSGSFPDNQKCVDHATSDLKEEGADLFLAKPFSMDALAKSIEEVLKAPRELTN